MSKHYAVSRIRWLHCQQARLELWKHKKIGEERKKAESKYLPVVRPYFDQLPIDAHILEIGCTCLTYSLPQKHKTYLDPLLDDLRRMFPGELPQGEYIVGMAEDIAKENHSYDLIVCLNAIPYTLNPELVMNEMKRLLKEDGLLILSIVVHSGCEARLHYLAERWHLGFCRGGCPYYYSLAGIRNTLKRHFAIKEQIPLGNKQGWIPGFRRQEYLFICGQKSSGTVAGNDHSAA